MKLLTAWYQTIFSALFQDIIEAPFEKRSYIAFSVATGLFWAFTPTVFIQQVAILVYWLAVRQTSLNFHFPLAWAWTWISNPWTMAFLYYLYYSTGSTLLDVIGVAVLPFETLNFSSVSGFGQSVSPIILPLCVGSILFSLASALLGYNFVKAAITLKFR